MCIFMDLYQANFQKIECFHNSTKSVWFYLRIEDNGILTKLHQAVGHKGSDQQG